MIYKRCYLLCASLKWTEGKWKVKFFNSFWKTWIPHPPDKRGERPSVGKSDGKRAAFVPVEVAAYILERHHLC